MLVESLCIIKASVDICLVGNQFILFFGAGKVGLLVDDQFGLFTVLSFLSDLVFEHHAVLRITCLQTPIEEFALLQELGSLEHLSLSLLVLLALKTLVVAALTLAIEQLLFLFLTFVYFALVLEDCAPLVELAALGDGVVALLLRRQILDLRCLLIQWFLNTICHLEGVHNHICSSLHFPVVYFLNSN